MIAPVDPVASLHEVFRVAAQEAALMAVMDGYLVGTMGIIKHSWWYNPAHDFLTDRWHFVLPQYRHGLVDRALEDEALAIGAAAGIPFINQGKLRRRKNGSYLMMPILHPPPEN